MRECAVGACLYTLVKQYEEAIPRYEEVLAIQQRVYGDQHPCTVDTTQFLAWARQQAKKSHETRSMWATSFACVASAATSRRT